MADDTVGPLDFGIEWRKAGRLMVGTPWVQEGNNPPQDLTSKLTLPVGLWPEYKEFLLALGPIMADATLIEGNEALVEAG